MAALNDAEIRIPLKSWIYEATQPEIVLDEIAIREGSSRADLTALSSFMHAYEIKGQTDRMTRLKNQVPHYGTVMHKVTMVTTPNHLRSVVNHIPDWWGIIRVDRFDRGFTREMFETHHLTLEIVREAGVNPEPLDMRGLGLMLWKREMLEFLKGEDIHAVQKNTKFTLIKKLIEHFKEPEPMAEHVSKTLVRRVTDYPEWAEVHVRY